MSNPKKSISEAGKLRSLRGIQQAFPFVTGIIDATSSIEVAVTPKNVREAREKKHMKCAMANACTDLDGVKGAIISMSRAYLIRGTTAYRYEIPDAVAREIVAFDRARKFAPGTYTLKRIAASHKFGAGNAPGGGHARIKSRKKQHVTTGVRPRI